MGNPADSKWFATPRAARNRKPLSVTLSDKARELLEVRAGTNGWTLSGYVEWLITGIDPEGNVATAREPARKKGRGSAKP